MCILRKSALRLRRPREWNTYITRFEWTSSHIFISSFIKSKLKTSWNTAKDISRVRIRECNPFLSLFGFSSNYLYSIRELNARTTRICCFVSLRQGGNLLSKSVYIIKSQQNVHQQWERASACGITVLLLFFFFSSFLRENGSDKNGFIKFTYAYYYNTYTLDGTESIPELTDWILQRDEDSSALF